MTLFDLQQKWQQNAETCKSAEIGGGLHEFVKDVLTSSDLLYQNLKKY